MNIFIAFVHRRIILRVIGEFQELAALTYV